RGMEDDMVYVAIPLRNDRAVIGVVAGFWPRATPVTAAHLEHWLSLTDELTLSIQLSELLRRAQVNGAEAERVRMNDDIHASLAQSIFALSLEIARVSAGKSAPEPGDLRSLQAMADDLSTDVRSFLSDGRAGAGGTNLVTRLRDLTSDLRETTGAEVRTDHRVDWDEYSSDFADYIARVVTEAFRNITKHSSATHISFRSLVDEESKHVVIEIADDGANESPERPSSPGAGLGLIRELTARWNGRVSFETSARGATLTIVVLPEHQSEWAVAQRILQADTAAG
ncbi:MAG: ATP-binding protein, partial [Actinomycetota bacterium]|nr:ATP-binding protein [Actinomycetota bacterium]